MTTNGFSIRDLLHGTEIGRMQSSGIMQVLPLVSKIQDERFVSPSNALFSTNDYGTMVFKNQKSKPMIVPCHVGYIVKEAAQNHAMSHTGLVGSDKKKTFETACCIQESQGGSIGIKNHEMLILPFPLRESALRIRDAKEYSKLWSNISDFNQKCDLPTEGHLEYFFERFKKELDVFVAEFETVPQQVGAIILVNGGVVGFERGPSTSYWRSIWRPLIRECYGSLSLFTAKLAGNIKPKHRIPMKAKGITKLSDIKNELERVRLEEVESAKDVIRSLIDESFEINKEGTLKETNISVDVGTIENKQLFGQVVRDGEKVVYASVLVKEGWAKNRDWFEAKKFAI